MKSPYTTETFAIAKRAFVKKYGDDLLMASGDRRAQMVREAAPLSAYARMPTERFITAVAKLYTEEGCPL